MGRSTPDHIRLVRPCGRAHSTLTSPPLSPGQAVLPDGVDPCGSPIRLGTGGAFFEGGRMRPAGGAMPVRERQRYSIRDVCEGSGASEAAILARTTTRPP